MILRRSRRRAQTILYQLASDCCKAENRHVRAAMLLNAAASLNKRDPLLKSTSLGRLADGAIDLI
jgi:hypothetical protein